MKNQIEKSNDLLLDIKTIESLYVEGLELIKDFENGSQIPSKNINIIVGKLTPFNDIGTRFMSFLIDCENNNQIEKEEIKKNLESALISIINIKDKYRNLNFLIRQDLLKSIINIGQEIQNCLDCIEEGQLNEVA